MNIAAVYSCVKVISETMALMDLYVKRAKGKFYEIDSTHPLNNLYREPSPLFNRYQWIQVWVWWALLWGNGYCKIRRNRYSEPVEFIICPAYEVTVKKNERGRIFYEWFHDGVMEIITSDNMLHLKNLSSNGLIGMSPIAIQRQSLGGMQAKMDQEGAFYTNGAKGSGVLMTPGTMGKKEHQNLTTSFRKETEGAKNRFKTIVLEEGVKYQQLTIPQNDAQFLESKKYDRSEVAGWYRVPPYKIGDHEKSTYSNIDGQERSFAKDTIVPWAMNVQQELDRKLLFADEPHIVNQFNLDDLIKGDLKARYEVYEIATRSAIMKPIEAREAEGFNTSGMPEIDNFFMNSATMSVKQILEGKVAPDPNANENNKAA